MTYLKPGSISLLFLLLFCFGSSLSAAGLQTDDVVCEHPDYAPLKALYDATNGDNWTRSDNWLEDCEPCRWVGIRCDMNDRVTAIALPGIGLDGKLPEAIGQLEFLYVLSLPRNNITGQIPASVAQLPNLTDLYLSDNQLSGSLPDGLLQRGQLTSLRLENNLFTGNLPEGLNLLRNLQNLYLGGNEFSGQIPEGLADFPNLRFADFRDNNLSGCLPEDLVDLCDASKYRLKGNRGLPLEGEFRNFCDADMGQQVGVACNDGDDATLDDQINDDCGCGISVGIAPPGDFFGEQIVNQTAGDDILVGGDLPLRMTVYPNPVVTEQEVNVQLPGGEVATIRLLSITGRTLVSVPSTGEFTRVRLPNVQPGLYLLEARSAGQKTVKRLMVR